jgi:hypothetical protein
MSIYGDQIKLQFEEAVEKGYNSFSVDVEGILDSEDFKLIDSLGLGYTVENITNEAVPLGKADGSPNRLRVFGVTRESYDRFIFSVQQPRKPEHIKIMNVLRDNFERYYPKATSLTDANVYHFMVNPSGRIVLVTSVFALTPGAVYVTAKRPLKPMFERCSEEFTLLMGVLEELPKVSFTELEAIFRMIGWL